jgi:hypothetical protein
MSLGKSIFDQLRGLLGKPKAASEPPQAPKPEAAPLTPAQAEENLRKALAGTDAKWMAASKAEALLQKAQLPAKDRLPGKSGGPVPPPVHPPARSKPEVDLVLGIDFGTSCSKVVIGDPGWLGRSYAVPVGGAGTGLERFLRPTRMLIGKGMETNLKMRLMADPDSEALRHRVTLYLAGIIRDSLHWFESDGPPKYRDRQAVWSLNLGFPDKQVGTGPLVDAYRSIADLATRLASTDLPLTLTSIRSLRPPTAADSFRREIPPERIHLYPEIAAQLAGYVNSPYRAQGSLLLIDVGAGTLDVSTIILHGGRAEDIVSFHFCEVGPFGALKLLEARIDALNAVKPGSVTVPLDAYQSGTVATPEVPAAILGDGRVVHRAFVEAFDTTSARFADEAIRLAISCSSRFRVRQREAHADAAYDPWPGQLRFFFTGGGSRLGFYRNHFTKGPFEQELTKFTRWEISEAGRRGRQQGLRLEPLPTPGDLEGLPRELDSHFDRLSVAHGLAYGSENLMRITSSVH